MTKVESSREEYIDWCKAMGVNCVDDLNKLLDTGYGVTLINICEARQERKYAEVADQIFFNKDKKRIVMMSGPSSSGKTSSSLRIAQQCAVLGIKPVVIELDNYFRPRDETPLDENGEKDYEALGAMNIELLNSNLKDLLSGKEVQLPTFDFIEGKTVFEPGNVIKLEDNEILFMEGIHALNPALTPEIDQNSIFHVYIAPLSALPVGEKSHGSTTDKRLLRRIVRDNRTRGITPAETIMRWPSVRRGEIKNIFPYEDNADVVFNSTMLYDVPLLKYYADPLLFGITEASPAYLKAQELIAFNERFTALKPAEIAAIPPTSIMREFIGGQMLKPKI